MNRPFFDLGKTPIRPKIEISRKPQLTLFEARSRKSSFGVLRWSSGGSRPGGRPKKWKNRQNYIWIRKKKLAPVAQNPILHFVQIGKKNFARSYLRTPPSFGKVINAAVAEKIEENPSPRVPGPTLFLVRGYAGSKWRRFAKNGPRFFFWVFCSRILTGGGTDFHFKRNFPASFIRTFLSRHTFSAHFGFCPSI